MDSAPVLPGSDQLITESEMKTLFTSFLALFMFFSAQAMAADVTHMTPGVGGYDLVSYHNSKRPLRGNGHFVSEHDGVTYLFANEANKKTFDANPGKYIPAYGGYCAFGVSVGKKFHGDPEVWRVVDGRLYLNLDAQIQDMWLKDVPGSIKTADAKWPKIINKAPSEL